MNYATDTDNDNEQPPRRKWSWLHFAQDVLDEILKPWRKRFTLQQPNHNQTGYMFDVGETRVRLASDHIGLSTPDAADSVIDAMVEHSKINWPGQAMRIYGSDTFKERSWYKLHAVGIKVIGYIPIGAPGSKCQFMEPPPLFRLAGTVSRPGLAHGRRQFPAYAA